MNGNIEYIELIYISRLLTSTEQSDIDYLLTFDESYFFGYRKQVQFIFNHYSKHNILPSPFELLVQFSSDSTLENLVESKEPVEYIGEKLRENKSYHILVNMVNTINGMQDKDLSVVWQYIESECEHAANLIQSNPMDIVKQAKERAQQVVENNKQKRIPTGFPEIDKVMYGGLSTIEELLVIIARTNSGKSWACVRMAESAQKHGFPVAYYSPEMQSAYLATRFDTWRGNFENSRLYRGDYSKEYIDYIDNLSTESTPVFVIEDKDFPEGVSVRSLDPFIKKNEIKLLIIDGISYMKDDENSTRDQDKYKNIAHGLFKLSKKYGCAVVLVMQANREVKNKDDKGESIPDLYNAEGSDQPCRIATQAFGIRQIFDKHVLDIKLLKARMANNQNPVFSYAWDINTGNINYIPSDDFNSESAPTVMPTVSASQVLSPKIKTNTNISLIEDDDDDVEF